MKKIILFYTACIIIILSPPSEGGITAVVQDEKIINLAPYIEILPDDVNILRPEEFQSTEIDIKFRPLKEEVIGLKPGKARWLRFSILIDTNAEDCLLHLDNPWIDLIDFYSPSDSGYSSDLTGSLRPISDRKIRQRTFIFPLVKDENKIKTYYLRLESHTFTSIPAFIRTEKSLAVRNQQENLIFGAAYGILAAMCIFALLIFFMIKDRIYLKYALYILPLIAVFITLNGHYRIIAGTGTDDGLLFIGIFTGLSIIAASVFTRSLLDTKINSGRIDRVLISAAVMSIIMITAAIAGKYSTALLIGYGAGITYVTGAVWASVVMISRGYRPAVYFLISLAAFTGLFICSVLSQGGVISSVFRWDLLLSCAAGMGALILSLSLADRIRILRQEREYLPSATGNFLEGTTSDRLTGLFNSNYLKQMLRWEVRRAVINESPLCLVSINIDNLKKINDSHGREQGDHIIKGLSKIISKQIRKGDSPCRQDDDNFLIIIPGANQEETTAVAERIRLKLYRQTFNMDGVEVRVTLSAGLVQLRQNEDGALLIQRALSALKKAKEAGRNRVSAL